MKGEQKLKAKINKEMDCSVSTSAADGRSGIG
jgi:hypothetical protein